MDEVTAIKRAMKIAAARKDALLSMKDSYETESKDLVDLKSQTKKQRDQLILLQQDNEEKDSKIKELQFEIGRLKGENDKVKSSHHVSSLEHKAVIGDLNEKIRDFNFKIARMKSKIDGESMLQQKIIESLDRKLRSSSDNVASSSVSLKLLAKLQTSVQNVHSSFYEDTGPNRNSLPRAMDSSTGQSGNHGNNDNRSSSDPALIEICDHLESENMKLEEMLESTRCALGEAKKEAGANQIIPHYRFAIIRARNQSLELLKQLIEEQNNSKILKEQLACAYDELRRVFQGIQDGKVALTLSQEREGDVSKKITPGVSNSFEYTELLRDRRSTMSSCSTGKPLLSTPSATDNGVASIDEDIAKLLKTLEKSAISHAKSLIYNTLTS